MVTGPVNCHLSDKRKDEKDISVTPWKTTSSNIFMLASLFSSTKLKSAVRRQSEF